MSDLPKLKKRQADTLEEIHGWKTGYSKFWTLKTNESLQKMGLVMIGRKNVALTAKGKQVLKALQSDKD